MTHPNLSIATWNLERPLPAQRTRRNRLLSAMATIDADVWVLTEAHASLRPGAGYGLARSGAMEREHKAGEVWVAIWSRLPMTALAATRDTARSVAVRIEPSGSRALIVYGTVLPWLGSGWRGVPAAGGAAFSAALAAQASDWQALQSAHPDADLVVAGDLNQDLSPKHHYGSTVNRALLAETLDAAGLTCVTADEADPVWRQTEGQWASIDHVCLSQNLAARQVGRARAWPAGAEPQRELSDHFGVVLELAAGGGQLAEA